MVCLRNGFARPPLDLSFARASRPLILAIALLLLGASLVAQDSQPTLLSFGAEVKTGHSLVVESGEVWIALSDAGLALGKSSPVCGIRDDRAVLEDSAGRHIYQPIRKIAGESYVRLRDLCDAAGLSPVFDQASGVCRIRRDLSGLKVGDGKISLCLPNPPKGCKLRKLDGPPRLYFDIPATNLGSISRSWRIGTGGIRGCRIGQNDPDTVRVVLELDSTAVADKIKLASSKSSLEIICPGIQPGNQVALAEKVDSQPTDSETASPSPKAATSQAPVQISSVEFKNPGNGKREIRILASRAAEPRARFLTDPLRLSLDFPDTICGVDYPELLVDDSVVRGIRSGQFLLDPAIARIVLDLKKSVYYQMWYDEETGEIVIALEPAPATGGKLSDKVVVVDPGHGDRIVGARRTCGDIVLKEEEINLRIGLELQKLLEQEGVNVVMTRTDGSNLGATQQEDLAGRVRVAQDAAADLFVSIHCNATGVAQQATKCGTETYYYSPRSFWLADSVHRKLVEGLGTRDGGTRVARFHVLTNTCCPSILVEVAYLSNVEDQRRLMAPDFAQRAAKAIFDGLKAYVEGEAWD
jgi:N-acetylmuramoyl-L-alanine amidase